MVEKSLSNPERKRKLNFSTSEISKITELVEENLEIIQSKLTNSVTNRTKQETWAKIAAQVNAIGVAHRSVQEIKDKWKNLQSMAKKEFVHTTKKPLDKQAVVHRVKNQKRPRRKLFDFLKTLRHSLDCMVLKLVVSFWVSLGKFLSTCNSQLIHAHDNKYLFDVYLYLYIV